MQAKLKKTFARTMTSSFLYRQTEAETKGQTYHYTLPAIFLDYTAIHLNSFAYQFHIVFKWNKKLVSVILKMSHRF